MTEAAINSGILKFKVCVTEAAKKLRDPDTSAISIKPAILFFLLKCTEFF